MNKNEFKIYVYSINVCLLVDFWLKSSFFSSYNDVRLIDWNKYGNIVFNTSSVVAMICLLMLIRFKSYTDPYTLTVKEKATSKGMKIRIIDYLLHPPRDTKSRIREYIFITLFVSFIGIVYTLIMRLGNPGWREWDRFVLHTSAGLVSLLSLNLGCVLTNRLELRDMPKKNTNNDGDVKYLGSRQPKAFLPCNLRSACWRFRLPAFLPVFTCLMAPAAQ